MTFSTLSSYATSNFSACHSPLNNIFKNSSLIRSSTQNSQGFSYSSGDSPDMERKVLAVCSMVTILGILMVATGFAAEGTRTKFNQVIQVTPTTCKYPQSPALGLGLTAALSLLLAQITINVSTGCICCRRGPRPPAS